MDDRGLSDTKAYRNGVVLGFTVAEVILLVLFALLLALAALLIKGKESVAKSEAINKRFDAVLIALEQGDANLVKSKIEEALKQQIDYEKKGQAFARDVIEKLICVFEGDIRRHPDQWEYWEEFGPGAIEDGQSI